MGRLVERKTVSILYAATSVGPLAGRSEEINTEQRLPLFLSVLYCRLQKFIDIEVL